MASNTDTLSSTGTSGDASQGRSPRSRRITVAWAGVAAALLAGAGLAYATFGGGDDPAVRPTPGPTTPTSVEVTERDDYILPGTQNVPL